MDLSPHVRNYVKSIIKHILFFVSVLPRNAGWKFTCYEI